MNSCNDHITNCISNGRNLLAPFVSPQERLRHADKANPVLVGEWPDSDIQTRYASNYGLIGWFILTNADLLHNVRLVEYLLDPKILPFLHIVDFVTVSAFPYFL